MLKAVSTRIDQKDEGFTLIELMVVLVVIGILMAIAIPTFLGAKNTANDRAAQESVRNALTAETEYFTNNQAFTSSRTTLLSLEPALGWTNAIPTTTAGSPVLPKVTSVNGSADNVMIEAQSASGGCVFIDSEAQAPTAPGTFKAGTYYATSSVKCNVAAGAPATITPTTAVRSGKGVVGTAATAATWGTSW